MNDDQELEGEVEEGLEADTALDTDGSLSDDKLDDISDFGVEEES